MPRRSVFPAAAIAPADVPAPDAAFADILRFADLADGYAYADHPELAVLGNRLATVGPDALSIRELWNVLFVTYRAHRHAGGYRDSALIGEMRAIVGEIGRRVEARGQGLDVWTGDITRLDIGAIVNAANERMLGGGGVDGAIHRAAGEGLEAECREVPEVRPGVRCPTGEARITGGHGLFADHVIHTVGPVWRGGGEGEDGLLASAYRSSLALADAHGLGAVAFPAISTGVYGFPADRAAGIAVRTVRDWQAERAHPVRVLLVAYDEAAASTLRAAAGA